MRSSLAAFLVSWALLILLLLETPEVSAGKTEIIDNDDNIARVAQIVCQTSKGQEKQLSQATTIGRLVDYFRELPAGHRLSKCRQQFSISLERLRELLETASENVCSDEKLRLIEQFHRRYISRVRKYREEQEDNQWRAPWLVKLFFMHYAGRVSSICEKSASIVIAQVADQLDAGADPRTKAQIERLLGQINDVLGVSDLSRGYDSAFLLWNLIDKLPVEESRKFSAYLIDADNDSSSPIRLMVKMREADRVRQLKEACSSRFRPLYSKSMLPVLRLVDLGYYPDDDYLVKEVRENDTSRRLFSMTQVCEVLRPIAVVADHDWQLAPGQIVILPKEQHFEHLFEVVDEELGEEDEDDKDYESVAALEAGIDFPDNSMDPSERWDLVESQTAQTQTRKALQNTVKREDALKLLFKELISGFRAKIKSKLGYFFMANSDGQLKPAVDQEELAAVNEKDLAAAVQSTQGGGSSTEVATKKAGFGATLAKMVKGVFKLIGIAVALCLVVVLFVMLAMALAGWLGYKWIK